MAFSCDKCGLCCKHVGNFRFMQGFDRGDGTCKYLTEENTCEIYDSRPPICNTELMYERVYSRFMTRDAFDEMNTSACITLKNAAETQTL